ncbi:VCBS domain-containing protein [Enterovibrio norvegicus]|uniref:VCBS domain-containing protein n=1 Tax=Enterovibrio norvegicus TaxID=188144 RepID=UPI003BABBAD6
MTDVDDGDTPSFDNVSIDGDYGTFTLTDGNWTYTVDPSKADALNDNQTEQEVFTLTASDGTVQQITVDVTGTDDAAVVSGNFTASKFHREHYRRCRRTNRVRHHHHYRCGHR